MHKAIVRALLLIGLVFLSCLVSLADTIEATASPAAYVATNFSYESWYNSASGYGGTIGSTWAPTSSQTTSFTIDVGSLLGSLTDGTLSLSGLSSGNYTAYQNNHYWHITYGGNFANATAGSASMSLGNNGSYALTPDMLAAVGAGNDLIVHGFIFATIFDAGGGSYSYGYSQPVCYWGGQCGYYSDYHYWSSGSFTFSPNLVASADLTPAETPEPATMALLGSGLLGVVGARKKWRK